MKCTGCGQEIGPPPAKCIPCGKSFVVKKRVPPPEPDIKIVDEPAAAPPLPAAAPLPRHAVHDRRRAGRSETMTGNMDTGSYVWAVVNASETRGSRVKIKFNGKER